MCGIDLKNAYFSVTLHSDPWKLVRLFWAGNLNEFLCLCCSLGLKLRIFTKLLKFPISVLRHLMIGSISYLNDLLTAANSMNKILITRNSLCDLFIAPSRICDISEETFVRSCARNGVLSVDCDIGSMPEVIQDISGITSGFDKPNGNTFFNH